MVVAGAAAFGFWAWQRTDAAQLQAQCDHQGEAIAGVWSAAVAEGTRAAFIGSGVPHASQTWDRVAPRLDRYADQWRSASAELCRRRDIGHSIEPRLASASAECLDEHRERLADLVLQLGDPDAATIDNAAQAAASLPVVTECTDDVQLRNRAEAPEDPQVRAQLADVRSTVSQAWAAHSTGRYETALARAEDALAQAEVLGWVPLTVEIRLALGAAQEALGRYADAEATYERAYFDAGALGLDLDAQRAANGLTYVVGHELDRHAEGLRWGRVAQMLGRRLGLGEHLVQADTLGNLGAVHLARMRYDEALPLLREALAMREAILGPDHVQTADSISSIGVVHQARTAYEDAIEAHQRALAIRERSLGPDHPAVADSLSAIGNSYTSLGRYDEARETFERALSIQERGLGPEHPDIAQTLANVARTCSLVADHEGARVARERALKILEASLGPEHPDVGSALQDLGLTRISLSDFTGSIEALERALRIREASAVPPLDLAETLFTLGQVLYENGGDKRRGYDLAKRGYDLFRAQGDGSEVITTVVASWLQGHPRPPDE